jgi:hypothetical protein
VKSIIPFILLLACTSCRKTDNQVEYPKIENQDTTEISTQQQAYRIPPRPEYITGDFDGDTKRDTVYFVKHTQNGKYGLKLVFANHVIDTIGMGKEIVGQGFDDIEWAGIFETAPKGESYAENVDEEGDLLSEDQIPADSWIKLPNDGIFIHAAESCGGGIIYLEKGEYKWIQQE